MTAKPEELAAELYDLWKAGAVTLPLLANVHTRVTDSIDADSIDDADAFLLPSSGAASPAGPAFARFRDALQTAMADTAEAMTSAGTSLVALSVAYTGDDTATGDELDRLKKERLESPELDQAPPFVDPPHRPN